MHSRIFQIGTQPIPAGERLTESYMEYDSYLPFDYVANDKDRLSSIEWLGKLDGLVSDPSKGTVTLVSKKAFFAQYFDQWKKEVAALSQTTFDDFISSKCDFKLSGALFNLNEAYSSKGGFYVLDDLDGYDNLDSLQNFVRNKWEEGTTLYIGGTLDYHI